LPGSAVLIAAATVATGATVEVPEVEATLVFEPVADVVAVPVSVAVPVVVADVDIVTEPIAIGAGAAETLLVGMADVPRLIAPPTVPVATTEPVEVAVAVAVLAPLAVFDDATGSVVDNEEVPMLLEAVADSVVPAFVAETVLVALPPLVSGVSTQLSTMTTLSSPDGVNATVQVWIIGLPFASVVDVVVVVVFGPLNASSLPIPTGRASTLR